MKKEIPWALVMGPVFAVLTYLLLSKTSLDYPMRALSAIAIQTLIWWFFEAMNPAVAGLVFACLASLLGIASAEKVFAPFANPVIFFFLGGAPSYNQSAPGLKNNIRMCRSSVDLLQI